MLLFFNMNDLLNKALAGIEQEEPPVNAKRKVDNGVVDKEATGTNSPNPKKKKGVQDIQKPVKSEKDETRTTNERDVKRGNDSEHEE